MFANYKNTLAHKSDETLDLRKKWRFFLIPINWIDGGALRKLSEKIMNEQRNELLSRGNYSRSHCEPFLLMFSSNIVVERR